MTKKEFERVWRVIEKNYIISNRALNNAKEGTIAQAYFTGYSDACQYIKEEVERVLWKEGEK